MVFDFVVAPLLSVLAGAVFGTILNFAPIKSLKNKTIIVIGLALVTSFGFYFLATLFSSSLSSIFFFQAFASILAGTIVTEALGFSSPFAASILLIVFF